MGVNVLKANTASPSPPIKVVCVIAVATQEQEDVTATASELSEAAERMVKIARLAQACTKAAAQQRQIGNAAKAAEYEEKARNFGGSAGGATAYKQVQQLMAAGDYAGVIAMSILGLGMYYVVDVLHRKISPWQFLEN